MLRTNPRQFIRLKEVSALVQILTKCASLLARTTIKLLKDADGLLK
jgi:hypothetical protein